MLAVLVRGEAQPFRNLTPVQVFRDVDIKPFEQCTCSSLNQSRFGMSPPLVCFTRLALGS
jgi:hypothetical protein